MQRLDVENSLQNNMDQLYELVSRLHGKYPPTWSATASDPVMHEIQRACSTWKVWKLNAIPVRLIQRCAQATFQLHHDLQPFLGCHPDELERSKREFEKKAVNIEIQIDDWFKIVGELSVHASLLGDESQKWRNDLERNINALEAAKQQSNNAHSEYKKRVNELSRDVDKVRQAAQDALADMGVQSFAGTFKRRATLLNRQAIAWLIAGVLSLIVAAASAYWFSLHSPATPLEWSMVNIQYLTTRLLIVGSMVGFSVWSLRMYRVSRHLAEVYQHRALALVTFRLFARNAGLDEKSRDHLMRAATNAVFNMGPTGLLSPNAEEAEGVISMFERANSAIKK